MVTGLLGLMIVYQVCDLCFLTVKGRLFLSFPSIMKYKCIVISPLLFYLAHYVY